MVDLGKIAVLAKERNISLTELANRVGISYQALNKIIRTNSTKIETLISIANILDVSPSVFFGEDEMNNESSNTLSDYNVIDTEEKYIKAIKAGLKMLPEVDFTFSAGTAELIANTDKIVRYWYLPDCEDCEAVAPMVGTSMMPTFPPGCEMVLKRYGYDPNKPNTISFGNVFGIVVEDSISGQWHGYIKILRRHHEPEMAKKYWIAHSINTAEFDDFDIEIAQVRGLWIVKQHIVTNILL